MIAERIASLSEVAKVALEEREISYPLRDFPDGFYADPKLHLCQRERAFPRLT